MQTLQKLRDEISQIRNEIEGLAAAPVTKEFLWKGYTPLPIASGFNASDARFLTAFAGIQSGKTWAAAGKFILRIYEDRERISGKLIYWAVAPTYPLTRRMETVLRYFLTPLGLIIGEMKSERILRLRGDITIQFKSGNNPDHLVAEPVNGMWIDEAARLKEDAWKNNLEGRTTATCGWAVFTSSSRGRNWFHRTIIKPAEDKVPGYECYFWVTADNTAAPGIVAEVERKRRELPPAIFKREYEASLDAFEGQIYEEWNPTVHVFSGKAPPISDLIFGYDWGYKNLGVLLAIIIDSEGDYYVVDEVAMAGRTLDWWAEEARDMQDRVRGEGTVYYDPSRPDCHEEFQKKGIYSEGADNSVIAGIEFVMRAIHVVDGKASLYVHESCKTLLAEFPTYQWDDREKPVKLDDHALDALRYAIFSGSRAVVRGV